MYPVRPLLIVPFFVLILLGTAAAKPLDDIAEGIAAAGRSNHNRAIELYTRAIKSGELARENLAAAYANRCLSFALSERPDRAIADCTQALFIEPASALAYNSRGMAYRRLARYEEAVADYTSALRRNPRLFAALGNRAYARFRAGDLKGALQDYGDAIAFSDTHPFLYGGRGIVNFALADFEEAMLDFSEARKLSPADPFWLVWGYVAKARFGRQAKPLNASGMAGWPGPLIELFAGRTDAARVLALNPPNKGDLELRRHCEALFFVGQHHLLAGRVSEAASTFRQITAIKASDVCQSAVADAELRRIN